MNFLNPYTYIGGAILLASLAGTFYYQGTQIHSWHVKYDNDEKIIAVKEQQIKDLTTAQNDQLKKSGDAVIKVVQGPREVQSIIKEVNATPAKPCAPPVYSDEVKNAF